MQEQKKRSVFIPEWGPPVEQETKKTDLKPPDTEEITNQLKEAERTLNGKILVCSQCGLPDAESQYKQVARVWRFRK